MTPELTSTTGSAAVSNSATASIFPIASSTTTRANLANLVSELSVGQTTMHCNTGTTTSELELGSPSILSETLPLGEGLGGRG